MVYTKTTWAATTRVSAQNLNNLETQYDEVMNLASTWNNHDSRYYLKSESNAKFYSAAYMGKDASVDADLLDGHHASDLIGTGLPIGSIVWWSKDSGSIPSGWYLCNGANGTSDYRDRFVLGSSGSWVLKSLYGAATVTPTNSSVTIGAFAITTNEMPAHTHSWTETHAVLSVSSAYDYYGYPRTFYYYNSTTSAVTTNAAGSGATHTHAGSTVTWSSESNLPPYRAQYLIKRMS